MRSYSDILSEFIFLTLSSSTPVADMVGNNIYPLRTKTDVKGGYIIVDSFETLFMETKDGAEADALTARILCVDKDFTSVSTLAAAVEKAINNIFCPPLDGVVKVTAKKGGIEDTEFLQELLIKVEL